MTTLEQAKKLLTQMSLSEKTQLLQWVVVDLSGAAPGIESRPGVCGGDACVAGTRTPVWLLEQARRQGMTEAELLHAYPTLHARNLANAWDYVRSFPDEIERLIHGNEEA